jgi:hypothetical protein
MQSINAEEVEEEPSEDGGSVTVASSIVFVLDNLVLKTHFISFSDDGMRTRK